jgi:ribonucleotide reductase alpha subunit
MELSADQIKILENLAGNQFSPGQIAMIMNLSRDEFISACEIDDSDPDYKPGHVKYHYDRGVLISKAEVDKGTLKRAKEGNQTSLQQFKKDVWQQKIEQEKQKNLVRSRKKMIANVEQMIESPGSALALIKADVEQIEFIRELFVTYSSKSKIIERIVQKWKIRSYEAERLFNEVVNFYYITNNEVKVEAWKNIYAERLDNLFLLCFNINDFETARRCLIDAAELRGVNKDLPLQLPPELLDRRPILYSMKPSDVGVTDANRHELALLIDNLEIDEKDKLRIRRDARIDDIDFEIMDNAED